MQGLHIDTHFFHDVCLYVLYGSAVVLTFVMIERLIYYVLLNMRTNRLGAVIHGSKVRNAERVFKRRDVISRSIAEYVTAQGEPGVSRDRLEDLSASLYIDVNSRVSARLWLLDTIVTAAPLLGLIGTILGIMDTFKALSAGGISDPAAVSQGIGAALLATAVGISVALYGLLGHNVLHRFSDHITEKFKSLILASSVYVARAGAPTTAAPLAKAA